MKIYLKKLIKPIYLVLASAKLVVQKLSESQVAKQAQDEWLVYLFVALARNWLVLDGLDQLLSISCTVHTLSSALLSINLYSIKKSFEKILGTPRIGPGLAG